VRASGNGNGNGNDSIMLVSASDRLCPETMRDIFGSQPDVLVRPALPRLERIVP